MGWQLTDVNDIACIIYHYISIVSVFYLKNIADDGISSHAFDEIASSL